ncbi:guanine nucleotide binding protein, alpha subunit [Collybia nuda]|uniref:Guanine nucleotide binding protein, alpha subunit n=1 Tax=Collybia nuda TaxID=64659 RepID=A0A9P6CNV6_9AGAR|nr:guanine nucleotide binding protein, alpha subunit [Collybia nuda]
MPHKDRGIKPAPIEIPNHTLSETRFSPTSFLPDVNEMAFEDESGMEESQRISREIDERILESKRALDKKKKSVQILLLGQSESGKSSVLKNFLLTFAPKQFHRERAIWKTVIQLNLIGSIKKLLEILQEEWETVDVDSPPQPNNNLRRIRLGLTPLLFIETNIMKLISPDTRFSHDLCVRSGGDWKATLMAHASIPQPSSPVDRKRTSHRDHGNKPIDPTSVLAASKDDIIVLWKDQSVRNLLSRRGVRMEEMSGFFLNDIDRIASAHYEPTNADIVRARIRTLGVEEHHFVIEKGIDKGIEVYITDVGGSQTQRARWIPYFEDVQTILFLAPLAFNQMLEEDQNVNRVEDSLMLWKEICRTKLLAKAVILLFFNKRDVLQATLAAGVQVKRYVPSYGDLPNEITHVTKYFSDKFKGYHRKLSPLTRPFLCHETSAIDTESMESLLMGVRETILRINLQEGILL